MFFLSKDSFLGATSFLTIVIYRICILIVVYALSWILVPKLWGILSQTNLT